MYYWLYFVALLSLAHSSIIIRWSQTEPVILGAWRLLFASMALFAWAKWKSTRKTPVKFTRRQKLQIFLTGFLFFVHLYSYAYAAHHTSIAYLMLIYSINPVFTAIGNLIFFKESIVKKHLIAFAFAFSGIFYLVWPKLAQGDHSLSGDLVAILAAVTFSSYALLSKHTRKSIPNSTYTSAFFAVASVCFFIFSFFIGVDVVPTNDRSWMGIALLTVFPTLLGHNIFTYCMNYIDIQVLSIGKLIEPVISALSAWYFFNEPITFTHLVAFVLISTGISTLIYGGKKKRVSF